MNRSGSGFLSTTQLPLDESFSYELLVKWKLANCARPGNRAGLLFGNFTSNSWSCSDGFHSNGRASGSDAPGDSPHDSRLAFKPEPWSAFDPSHAFCSCAANRDGARPLQIQLLSAIASAGTAPRRPCWTPAACVERRSDKIFLRPLRAWQQPRKPRLRRPGRLERLCGPARMPIIPRHGRRTKLQRPGRLPRVDPASVLARRRRRHRIDSCRTGFGSPLASFKVPAGRL